MVNFAPVAHLDRVLPSEGRGSGFDSRRVRHLRKLLQILAYDRFQDIELVVLSNLFFKFESHMLALQDSFHRFFIYVGIIKRGIDCTCRGSGNKKLISDIKFSRLYQKFGNLSLGKILNSFSRINLSRLLHSPMV